MIPYNSTFTFNLFETSNNPIYTSTSFDTLNSTTVAPTNNTTKEKIYFNFINDASLLDGQFGDLLLNVFHDAGICYEHGIGVETDLFKAFSCYDISAHGENQKAQCMVGYCYDVGIGTLMNKSKALEWYERSAMNGELIGQYNYANFCFNGTATRRDRNKAFYWYSKSGHAGYDYSQYRLGCAYQSFGAGANKDMHEAIRWYRKAYVQNNLPTLKKIPLVFGASDVDYV
ncbi:10975_t:CDS:2 [Ambispora leptoticha]|uniref:10975_t:CDS:1 n=1 Tax=Ambispora leptoticha TaxID=144679 RepID=A0A9N9AAJ4_9GLOM|nr:10975_t:CDS:2 [Ambispora leptoticha]